MNPGSKLTDLTKYTIRSHAGWIRMDNISTSVHPIINRRDHKLAPCCTMLRVYPSKRRWRVGLEGRDFRRFRACSFLSVRSLIWRLDTQLGEYSKVVEIDV